MSYFSSLRRIHLWLENKKLYFGCRGRQEMAAYLIYRTKTEWHGTSCVGFSSSVYGSKKKVTDSTMTRWIIQCITSTDSSEFRYRKPKLDKNMLVVVISKSGETADTLAALRLMKDNGVKTLAIVNVVGSSIAREADYVFYTLAGPEIAVAITTKAYSAQLMAGYVLSLAFSRERSVHTDGR